MVKRKDTYTTGGYMNKLVLVISLLFTATFFYGKSASLFR